MRHILFLVFFLLLLHAGTFAQSKFIGPSHPVNPQFLQPRIQADTIFMKLTYHSIWAGVYPDMGGTAIVERSDDGLRDTYHYGYGLLYTMYFDYNKDNRLTSVQLCGGPPPGYDPCRFTEKYTYDQDGRLTKTVHVNYEDSVVNYDYSTIVYTDSSYILNQIEYVFDSEGRLVRSGDTSYTYFENGYTEIGRFEKITYYFLDNGYRSKYITYRLRNGVWMEFDSEERTYRYRDDNSHSQGHTHTAETANGNVYGVDGGIVIQSEKPAVARIYSMVGLLVCEVQTGQGIQSMALNKGFYIVTMGTASYKVFVR